MTEYLKKSFMVRMGQGRAPKPEKCVRCGVLVDPVIYRLNRKPHCKECFSKPREVTE